MPDTGKRMEPFDTSKGEQMAKIAGAPLLAQFPIEPELAKLCDQGEIERYDSEIWKDFANKLLAAMSVGVQ